MLKVFSLGISLLGLLRGLSGQVSLENFLEDSLKEFSIGNTTSSNEYFSRVFSCE